PLTSRCSLLLFLPGPTLLYPLSLHDALPIYQSGAAVGIALADQWQRAQLTQRKLYKQLNQLYRQSPAACHAALETTLADDTLTSDRKSTRLNSSHVKISYAVFCLKKKRNL